MRSESTERGTTHDARRPRRHRRRRRRHGRRVVLTAMAALREPRPGPGTGPGPGVIERLNQLTARLQQRIKGGEDEGRGQRQQTVSFFLLIL